MRMTLTRSGAAAVLSALLVLSAQGQPAPAPSPVTTISVPDMDCPSCAKGVVAKVTAVAGVAKVDANVKERVVRVTPKDRAVLSPKALWLAVEAGGQDPAKLTGPSGTFTKTPPN
jgi:mercuric ion binding protein